MLISQAVAIENASLHGDWLAPAPAPDKANAPHCIALILPGSGPTDADGNQPGLTHNNLRDLASSLAEHGVASLRIDKRGVARSQAAIMDEAQLTFDTYVNDAVQWILWLRDMQSDLPIVLLGHSEGALVATLAAQRIEVSGVMALCAPTRRASVVLREQLEGKLPEHLIQTNEAILLALESDQSCLECPEELMVLYRPSVQPYLRSWFRYDPHSEAARLNCRYLWAWGDADVQLHQEWQHLASGQASVVFAGMNHSMRMTDAPEKLHANLIPAIVEFCAAP
jgi:uncharacterized protein